MSHDFFHSKRLKGPRPHLLNSKLQKRAWNLRDGNKISPQMGERRKQENQKKEDISIQSLMLQGTDKNQKD